MTTTTIARKPRAARPAPASGLVAALAEIPRLRLTVYAAGLVVDLLLAFALLSIVWGL